MTNEKKKILSSIAIDLGTNTSRFYKNGKLISSVASQIEVKNEILNKIIHVGRIADTNGTEAFIRKEIRKISNPLFGIIYLPFTALISVPSDENKVALRAFRDTVKIAGAKSVLMINDCFFAATGLGIDIPDSTYMIVDCGAGKTSITTANGFKIIQNNILDVAGNTLNETIQTYISHKYGIVVLPKTVENLKREHVNLYKSKLKNRTIHIKGIVKHSNIMKSLAIQSQEITDCLVNDIELLIENIVRHFENIDDKYREKIFENGIHLIGGGFKLDGLIDLIAKRLPVSTNSYNFELNYLQLGIEQIQLKPGLIPAFL